MRDEEQLKQDIENADLQWSAEHGYITLRDYFNGKPHTPEQEANAIDLLQRVNACCAEYVADGGVMTIDPDTGTYISGAKGGDNDGGFRLPASTTGKPGSPHRDANGVDVSDQDNKFDEWLTRDTLVKFGLWREAKQHTPTWAHLQRVPPKSGNRSFNP
jgi:hypothetical protein